MHVFSKDLYKTITFQDYDTTGSNKSKIKQEVRQWGAEELDEKKPYGGVEKGGIKWSSMEGGASHLRDRPLIIHGALSTTTTEGENHYSEPESCPLMHMMGSADCHRLGL